MIVPINWFKAKFIRYWLISNRNWDLHWGGNWSRQGTYRQIRVGFYPRWWGSWKRIFAMTDFLDTGRNAENQEEVTWIWSSSFLNMSTGRDMICLRSWFAWILKLKSLDLNLEYEIWNENLFDWQFCRRQDHTDEYDGTNKSFNHQIDKRSSASLRYMTCEAYCRSSQLEQTNRPNDDPW